MKICPKCGFANQDDANFCEQCAVRLKRRSVLDAFKGAANARSGSMTIPNNDQQAAIQKEIAEATEKLNQLRQQIIETEEVVLLQSFGLYEPQYDFKNAEEYRDRLQLIRNYQKDLIKTKGAVTGSVNYSVNGNVVQGRRIVQDLQKLLLRAFNSECDEIISKVRYSNFDASKRRITASYDAVSKLGKMMGVVITRPYYVLKIEELTLAFEYQQKKQQEKEEQKRIREQLREQAKLEKEIEEARKTIRKEQKHYQNALTKAQNQLDSCNVEAERGSLLVKIEEINDVLCDIDKQLKDIDYREANQRAGYVYVISNIGSFGENIYKIGMTRRLDPMERVSELSDASVPFNFDVHAMIFSEDAPGLEAALHRAFDDRKVNLVNQRREFFHVTLEEIKEVVKNQYDKTVEFTELPEAEQYRISLKMRQANDNFAIETG